MDDFKSIISFETQEYGEITVKLKEMLETKGLTRNRLKTLTGVKYEIIDRYYKAENILMVDLDFFSKVCFVLDCKLEDLLEYKRPDTSGAV